MRMLRPMLSATGAALALSLIAHPAPATEVPPTPEFPVPTVADGLPEELDLAAFYEPQTRCESVARPGTLALRNVLIDTYGPATAYITRTCTSSTSEHFDGRALDWMRNKRVPEQKQMVNTFLDWLLAPAADGTPHEMARRMGVMYIIWNGRMTRMYDPGRGWTEYRNCRTAGNTGPELDTSCHRDHVHFSMSWDGAAKQTSWWSGRAQTLGRCAHRYTSASPGKGTPRVITDPQALGGFTRIRTFKILDSRYGIGGGLTGPCRVAAGRSLYPTVPVGGSRVPSSADAVVVRVTSRSNAPARLSVWSSGASRPSGQVNTPIGKTEALVFVPLASNGSIGLSPSLGAAKLTAQVIGYVVGDGSPPDPDPGPVLDDATAPSAPQAVRAKAGPRAVRTAWEPPATDGGAPILQYRVQALASRKQGARVVGECRALPTKPNQACKIRGMPRREKLYWMSVSVQNEVGWTWAPRVSVRWN